MTSPATLPAGYNYSTQYVYDSANDVWRPQQADASGNMQAVGNVPSGSPDAGNPVKVGGRYNTAQPTLANGQRGDLQLSSNGALRIEVGGLNGVGANAANLSGDAVGAATQGLAVQAFGYAYNGASWDRAVKPNSTFRLLGTAASTNSNNVKASAGNLFKIIVNVAVAGKFLKLYNKSTVPTVGTDTPVLTIPLPTTGLVQIDVGGSVGEYFSAGIGFGVTGAIADADTTAVAANDLTGINFIYA